MTQMRETFQVRKYSGFRFTQGILSKNILYPLLALAVPLILTNLLQTIPLFFETIFLAHLGKEALAAGALVGWLFAMLITFLLGILNSINILVSHEYGANDNENIAFVVRDGLLLALLLTIPAMLLFWNITPILSFCGQDYFIIQLAKLYTHALTYGILPNNIILVCFELIIGLGNSRAILIFNLISVITLIFFSFVFIFGKLGMPSLGIAGAGWAFTLNSWVTLIFVIAYILIKKEHCYFFQKIFSLYSPWRVLELIRLGIPMGAMLCIEISFFFSLALFMGYLSSSLLAANQIVFQYMGISIGVIFSIAQAITTRMGLLLGAKKVIYAIQTSYMGILMALTFMTIITIFYCFFPTFLISIDFNIKNPNNFDIINNAKKLFIVSAIFQLLEAIRLSLFGALRAMKDTSFTLLASAVGFWGIAFPLGYFYFLKTSSQLDSRGIWIGMIIGGFISIIILIKRFQIKIYDYSRLP